MSEITAAYMPIMIGTYRYRTVLSQPWVLGLRADPFFREPWKYLDIDRSGGKLPKRDPGAGGPPAE
jgi:hypothetical protein